MMASANELVAVVTGSTSGIGLAIARNLLNKGCDVIITGLINDGDRDKLMAGLISEFGEKATFIPVDLRSVPDIQKFSTKVLDRYPSGVDILVNNAGFNHVANVSDYPEEKWDDSLAVMLSAPFHLCKRFIPSMHKKGWGRIVNISSQMGIAVSAPGKAVYSAAKSGLVGLTRGIALEEARFGITCNAICPGFADAPVLQIQFANLAQDKGITYEKAKSEIVEKIPTNRIPQPKDIAEMAEFLIFSKAGEHITGACQLIDGAFSVQ